MAGRKRSRYSRHRRTGTRLFNKFRRRVFRTRVRRIMYGVAIPKYYETLVDVSNGALYATTSTGTFGTAIGNLQAGAFSGCSLINAIPQGNAQGQRVGDKITIKYVQLALYFTNQSTTTTTIAKQDGMFCRYALFLDKRAANSTAKPIWDGHMWTTAGNPLAQAMFPMAFKHYDTLSRFKTLLDGQHRATLMTSDAANPSMSGTGIVQHFVKINKRFTYSKVGTDSSGDSLYDQDIYIQAIPSAPTCCSMVAAVRVCFTDC